MEYAFVTPLLTETDSEFDEETAVLESMDGTVEQDRMRAVVAALEDVDVEDTTRIHTGAASGIRSGTAGPGEDDTATGAVGGEDMLARTVNDGSGPGGGG